MLCPDAVASRAACLTGTAACSLQVDRYKNLRRRVIRRREAVMRGLRRCSDGDVCFDDKLPKKTLGALDGCVRIDVCLPLKVTCRLRIQ